MHPMEELAADFYRERCQKTVAALAQNGFAAYYCENGLEALKQVKALVPAGSRVGRGGSVTTAILNLFSELEAGGCTILDPYKAGLPPAQSIQIRRQILSADVMLASANAITGDGKIVNIDGVGNRVAAFIFGPTRVIMVAGKNKLVADVDAAIHRIKTVASPMNARRLNLNTPCAQRGTCIGGDGCSSPDRICSVTVILEKKPKASDIHVLIVGEDLGF